MITNHNMSIQMNCTSPTRNIPSNLNVNFEQNLSTEVVREKISQMNQPQIILWYIGPYGLKVGGVNYYRDNILSVLKSPNKPTAWLYDLSAWAVFKSPKAKLSSTSSKVAQIEKFNQTCLKCITSSFVFKAMGELDDISTQYLKEKLAGYKFLTKPSECFEEAGRKVKEVFLGHFPVLENLKELDIEKSYSHIQYLETFIIIEKIVKEQIDKDDNIQIVFALPNDETKYYNDDNNSFEKDLNYFLSTRFGAKLKNKQINVQFLCFNYSNKINHRPYNAPGRNVPKKINLGMIVGL